MFWNSISITEISISAGCSKISSVIGSWEISISTGCSMNPSMIGTSISAGCSTNSPACGISTDNPSLGFSCAPPKYSSSKSSIGVTPASNFGITPVRRSIMSPASCKALAFADSNFLCSASWRAASAARFVFSHSSKTSAMVICPVIWRSIIAFSLVTRLICPSESSPNISWKLILREPSISSSVAMCPVC